MADNTTLPVATGGDTVRTESLVGGTDPTSGNPVPLTVQGGTNPEVKVQLTKLITGRSGVDGGPASREVGFPVLDVKCMRLLEMIADNEDQQTAYLKEIRDLFRKGH